MSEKSLIILCVFVLVLSSMVLIMVDPFRGTYATAVAIFISAIALCLSEADGSDAEAVVAQTGLWVLKIAPYGLAVGISATAVHYIISILI